MRDALIKKQVDRVKDNQQQTLAKGCGRRLGGHGIATAVPTDAGGGERYTGTALDVAFALIFQIAAFVDG